MSKEIRLWNFVADRLRRGERVILLVVAQSTGSSPGRGGYKMAVGSDGDLIGSIGGGVMEVNLVEQSRRLLSATPGGLAPAVEQVHQKNSPNASGMVCSGRQTVIFKTLGTEDLGSVDEITAALCKAETRVLRLTSTSFTVLPAEVVSKDEAAQFHLDRRGEFEYSEQLGAACRLYIIGGGHCALALSELMSRLGFHISIFDDRRDLNTIAKNEFADRVTIIESYEDVGQQIPNDENAYVVVMTLGYASDAVVIRQLIDHDLKYLGVLGSKAKMAMLMKELRKEGYRPERLSSIHTPVGLPINSRTPEEIAVSIAAEIISIKNAS